jgi:hypothetical protein
MRDVQVLIAGSRLAEPVAEAKVSVRAAMRHFGVVPTCCVGGETARRVVTLLVVFVGRQDGSRQ